MRRDSRNLRPTLQPIPVQDDPAVHAEGERPIVVVGERPELVLGEERLVFDQLLYQLRVVSFTGGLSPG